MNYRQKKIVVFLIYLSLTLFFYRRIIFSSGVILGSDWSLPSTAIQMKEELKNELTTWSNQGDLFGFRQTLPIYISFGILAKIFLVLGITGPIYTKLLVILLSALSGYSLYLLAKFLKLAELPSVLAGIFYITAPIFFNYAIIGWIFVLLALVLLPMATRYFIESVEKNNLKYTLYTGFIYAFSAIQPQSIVWFMIVFLISGIYLIRDKKSCLIYLKNITILTLIFFFLNAYWLLGLLLLPDKNVLGSGLLNTIGSLGASKFFFPSNIIRLWGGLYNYQYEIAIINFHLSDTSFIVPALAFISILVKKYRRLVITFWIISLVPMVMYFFKFDRNLLSGLPFANLIRDFPRFTVLSTFGYALLIGIAVNYLLLKYKKQRQKIWFAYLGLAAFLVWILYLSPWWMGEIAKWGILDDCSDIRLRTKDFPKEYEEVEKILAREKGDQKALFIPIKGVIAFKDDKKFTGICGEAFDNFGYFSPVPGVLGYLIRSQTHVDQYADFIAKNLNENLLDSIKLTNIRFFVVRKDAVAENLDKTLAALDRGASENKLYRYYSGEKIVVYARRDFLPHFYVPKKIVLTDPPISNILSIVKSVNSENRLAIFFNKKKDERGYKTFDLSEGGLPTIEFNKINQTKYRLIIHKATEKFPLVFNETFHDQWKIYLASHGQELEGSTHLPANGYANAWLIDPKKSCSLNNCSRNIDGSYEMELTVEFFPQRLFYIGGAISIFGLFFSLLIIFWKKNYRSQPKG